MTDMPYFASSYELSRERFRASLGSIHHRWPKAELFAQMIDTAEDVSIDWIEAPSEKPETLLVMTAGEHGIEAFVGTAVIQLLVEEYLPKIDPSKVGLALMHTINPWGMKNLRRTNKANVDLNRNFVLDPMDLDRATNPDYVRLNGFLNPRGKLWGLGIRKTFFMTNLFLTSVLTRGVNVRNATLLGQYAFPQGIYYGGRAVQPETQILMDLYKRWFGAYEKVVHIDLHSGYGPRYQMSIVNSAYEPVPVEEHEKMFDYPRVVKTDSSAFYSINGDMIDYVYKLIGKDFPGKSFYSTAFEFGTVGDQITNAVWALRTMIFENQAYHHGTALPTEMDEVKNDLMEMFCPELPAWREIALDNTRQAFNGIFKTWGILD
jgi:hypothetical protein